MLILSVVTLFARELSQLIISPSRYASSLENWIEVLMLTFITAILTNEPNSVKYLSPLAILLAWAELLLLIGHHPKLSPVSAMFIKVCTTFLKLLWYIVLLIGFGFSFFLVFNPIGKVDEEVISNGFETAYDSVIRVFAMMTGDLAIGDLPFDVNPVISRLLFLLFLFFATLVLMNLLSIVAVNAQSLQNRVLTKHF